MRTFVDTPVWKRPDAVLSWTYYLGDRFEPGGPDVPYLAAPARAKDLSGLPPAHVTTMEFDPLRDEGIEYALGLLRAGVSVELHSYPGTFHGSMLVTDAADQNLALATRNLKQVDLVTGADVNTYQLLRYDKLVFTREAFKQVERRLQSSPRGAEPAGK